MRVNDTSSACQKILRQPDPQADNQFGFHQVNSYFFRQMLIKYKQCQNFSRATTFVNISARLSSISIFNKRMSLSLTISQK